MLADRQEAQKTLLAAVHGDLTLRVEYPHTGLEDYAKDTHDNKVTPDHMDIDWVVIPDYLANTIENLVGGTLELNLARRTQNRCDQRLLSSSNIWEHRQGRLNGTCKLVSGSTPGSPICQEPLVLPPLQAIIGVPKGTE